jgi:hypothetical protein
MIENEANFPAKQGNSRTERKARAQSHLAGEVESSVGGVSALAPK